MTSSTAPAATGTPPDAAALPSPAAALQSRFQTILRTQMDGVPLVNPKLGVQVVGMRPWAEHWLGVLVTPWFMNLVLLPRVRAHWQAIGERESRHYVFPAGVFEFIGSRDAVLGDYQACSLFSPMFEFADDATARDTAAAALAALFDAANRPASDVPPAAAAAPVTEPAAARVEPAPPPGPAPALSKRDFLFGNKPRVPREP